MLDWLRRLFGYHDPPALPPSRAQLEADALLKQWQDERRAQIESVQWLRKWGDPLAEQLNRAYGLPPRTFVFDPVRALNDNR